MLIKPYFALEKHIQLLRDIHMHAMSVITFTNPTYEIKCPVILTCEKHIVKLKYTIQIVRAVKYEHTTTPSASWSHLLPTLSPSHLLAFVTVQQMVPP